MWDNWQKGQVRDRSDLVKVPREAIWIKKSEPIGICDELSQTDHMKHIHKFLEALNPCPYPNLSIFIYKITIQKPEYIGSIIEEESIGKKCREVSIN